MKYKIKYELLKLLGGTNYCLFVSAHGRESNDDLELKNDQIVVMFYKPKCIKLSDFSEIMRTTKSIGNTKCNQSNYRKIITICAEMKKLKSLYIINDYAVYSGNPQDVEFFKYTINDNRVIEINISRIPDLNLSLNDILTYLLSFPIEFKKEISNEDKESFYVSLLNSKGNDNAEEYLNDIKSYLSDNNYFIHIGDIKLSNLLDKNKFIWVSSCRSPQRFQYEIKIGVPLFIFMFYSIYNIVLEVTEIGNEHMDITKDFMEKTHIIFKRKSYVDNYVKFIYEYIGILNESLIKILKKTNFNIENILKSMNKEDKDNIIILRDILTKIRKRYSDNSNILQIINSCIECVEGFNNEYLNPSVIYHKISFEQKCFALTLSYLIYIKFGNNILIEYMKEILRDYFHIYYDKINFEMLIDGIIFGKLNNEQKNAIIIIHENKYIKFYVDKLLKSLWKLSNFYNKSISKAPCKYSGYKYILDKPFIELKYNAYFIIENATCEEIYKKLRSNSNKLKSNKKIFIEEMVEQFYSDYDNLIMMLSEIRNSIKFSKSIKLRVSYISKKKYIDKDIDELKDVYNHYIKMTDKFGLSNELLTIRELLSEKKQSINICVKIFIKCAKKIINVLHKKDICAVEFNYNYEV